MQQNDAGGSDAALTKEQLPLLDQHLSKNLYLTTKKSRITSNKRGRSHTAKVA